MFLNYAIKIAKQGQKKNCKLVSGRFQIEFGRFFKKMTAPVNPAGNLNLPDIRSDLRRCYIKERVNRC